VLVTVGYYIAKIVGNMLRNLLRSTGVNNIYSFLGMDETKKPSVDLANVITNIVKAFIILFFTIEALNVLKLDVLNSIGNAVLFYIPFLVSATIILGVGFFVANLLTICIRNEPIRHSHTSFVKYL